MRKYKGSVAEYRSSEGKTIELPYRGPIEPTILDVRRRSKPETEFQSALNVLPLCHLNLAPRRTAVRVHLCGRQQAEGAVKANYIYPGDPTGWSASESLLSKWHVFSLTSTLCPLTSPAQSCVQHA